jgi:hypothetical protein
MEYVFLFYESKADFDSRKNSANTSAYWAAWQAYMKALNDAGVLKVGRGNILQPPTVGATVRLKDGERRVLDGPYGDTKEQLGGFVVLELANTEEAFAWAARCPAAVNGAVEVRPVWVLESRGTSSPVPPAASR